MIFWLITLGGVVRGKRVAVVQGVPVPGRGDLPLRVAVLPLPVVVSRGRGADARARRDRFLRNGAAVVCEVRAGLRQGAAPTAAPAWRQVVSGRGLHRDQRRAAVPVAGG